MKKVSAILAIMIFTSITAAHATEFYYTKQGYPFATTRAKLDQMIDIISSGDEAAFQKILRSGGCGITKAGVKVQLIEFNFPSTVKIRVFGETLEVYTLSKAIDK